MSATALAIATLYGKPDAVADLERAILRHMEHHIILEREACAKRLEAMILSDPDAEAYRDMFVREIRSWKE